MNSVYLKMTEPYIFDFLFVRQAEYFVAKTLHMTEVTSENVFRTKRKIYYHSEILTSLYWIIFHIMCVHRNRIGNAHFFCHCQSVVIELSGLGSLSVRTGATGNCDPEF